MKAIRQLLDRQWRAVRRLAGPVVRLVTRWVLIAKDSVVVVVRGVRERHRMRMKADTSYPVAISSGSTAALGTLAASPALAAALSVLVDEWLGIGHRHVARHPGRSSSAYVRRPWEDGGQALWDRNDWDED